MATNKPRLYIDACYYIDVAKGRLSLALDPGRDAHLPFLEGLLLAGLNGDVEIWGSTLIITECLGTEKNQAKVPEHIQKTFLSMLSSGGPVKMAAVDYFIAERARDLRWVDEINCGGGADMVHVATALELGCQEFLTTNEKRGPLKGDAPEKLAKLGLSVIQAPDTKLLPSKYLPPPPPPPTLFDHDEEV